MLSELPSDLRIQYQPQGSPPSWFKTFGPYFYPGLYGLGDLSPTQVLQNLKYNQEMPSTIPWVANRYTKIDPLSPMFRSDIPKYGFGDTTTTQSIIGIIVLMAILWFLFVKK